MGINVSDSDYEYTIRNLSDLREIVLNFQSHYAPGGWIYRGQDDSSWDVIPKAGRNPYNDEEYCMHRFSQWCREARSYTKHFPDNKWEQLALAQHHGLATNLLDWTGNPLIATYFACKDSELYDKNGVIYCYFAKKYITDVREFSFYDFFHDKVKKNNNDEDINKIDDVIGYIPEHFTRRIIAQNGCFTFHKNCRLSIQKREIGHPFKGQQLKKIVITHTEKENIIRELNLYGINYKSLFPDLDGLSKYINWVTKRL